MRLAGREGRSFLLRRTVRSRMTLLYGALFVVSGAVLLAIAGGFVSSKSAAMVRSPGSGSPVVARLAGPQGPSVAHAVILGSLVALAIMAAASAALGWLMAGHALRPLRTITATARRISEDNLHERLSFSGPDDELKQLADTIDDLLERLESAFAAQRRFVANASHELRTPLATMRASLDVALAKPDPLPVHTATLASRLRTELDRVDDLLEGFLALARAQHGALPDSTVFSLADLAAATLADRARDIAAAGLTVRSDAEPGGALIAGSRALVGRLADNVIANAIIHNEAGGWIEVSADSSGPWARLVVRNGGAVLDQQQVALLAQPFRRIGADRTGSDRGSGLGLSIVAAIAAAHGGTLELSALAAGGLRVTVTLPLALTELPHGDRRLAGAARGREDQPQPLAGVSW